MPLLLIPGLALLALGFLAPMLRLAWISLHRLGDFSLQAYAQVLASPQFFAILGHTVATAAEVTVLTALFAYPFACFVATRAGRHAGTVLALVSVPYLTSILIRSYAWVAILGANGLVNRALLALHVTDTPLTLVFNRLGSTIGMVHILLPMMVLPMVAAMQRIDPASLRAAAGLGAGPASAFLTVFLPLSWPGVTAGTALVFLNTLGFYVTPALLGGAGDYMLAQAIAVRVEVLAEFDTAAAQAVILLLLVAALMLAFRRRIVSAVSQGDAQAPRPGRVRQVPHALAAPLLAVANAAAPATGPMLWAYGLALLAVLLLPMAVVVILAFSSAPYLSFPPPGLSWRWFAAYFADAAWLRSTVFSLLVSTAASLTAVAVGGAYAMALVRGRFAARRVLWLCAVAPMILPHVALGLGLFFTMVAVHLNGTPAGFWLAYAVIGLPYAVVILAAAYARFDARLERAAASLGAAPWRVLADVTLPLLALSFATAFLFAFLAGFDDLIVSLFLSSPRGTTIAMRIWEDINLEISPKAAVVGVLQLGVLLAVAAPALLLRRRR